MWTARTALSSGQPSYADFASSGPLASVSYRSRATAPLSERALDELVRHAQRRNHAESITGMVIYDEGQFLQWLEGPPDALARVMKSINCDARHTDIEVLGEQRVPLRMFDGWDLKLGRKLPAHDDTGGVDDLFQRARGLSVGTGRAYDHLHAHAATPANVIAGRQLAELLLTDEAAACRLIDEVASRSTLMELFAGLLEPAARALGDLWDEDCCSDFDLTIALCRMQTEMRRISYSHFPACGARIDQASVLIAPQPGETHMLGAALDSEMLWQAGWQTRCEFPATDEALQDMLADQRFDVLDLSPSASFRREAWTTRVATTITGARRASRNQRLVIAIGGRRFADPLSGAGTNDVGADVYSMSSSRLHAALRSES
jgi:hypothetical protein